MASVEIPLHADPAAYEPKPVFGKLTYRGGLTLLAAALAETPLALVLLKTDVPIPNELVGLIALLPIVPIALVGLVKRHGLHFERWWPAMRMERESPPQLAWELPAVVIEGMGRQSVPRRERRALRREARADRRASRRSRKAEAAEDSELASAFLARFGREVTEPPRRRWPLARRRQAKSDDGRQRPPATDHGRLLR